MKKVLTMALIGVLCFVLVGCGNDSTESKKDENKKDMVVLEEEIITSEWSQFYTHYSSLESSTSEVISEALEADESNDLTYIWASLNSLNGSISLALTSNFFTESESTIKASYSIFGYTDIKYTENGDTAKVFATNSEGKQEKIELKYDKTSKTAEITEETNDSISVTSIYAEGDYYAKTYYSKDSNGENFTEIYSDGTIVKISYGSTGTQSESLYKNISRIKDEDFATKFEKTLKIENGTIVK